MNNAKLFSDEAANIYERAIGTLLKKNMLLYFAFADYEEVSSVKRQQTWTVKSGATVADITSHQIDRGPNSKFIICLQKRLSPIMP